MVSILSTALAEELSNYELTRKVRDLLQNQDISGQLPAWMKRLEISGLLEAEAGYMSLEDGNESDVALATMELGVDAVINDYVSGHVLFLWEEDDTEPVDLNEGFITLTGGADCPGYVSAGKLYVPFGNFETNMISDPLTLELGETRESAIQAGLEMNGFYGSVYLFNGDADEYGQDNHADNYGAQAGLAMETAHFHMDIGAGYISNIIDADGWEGLFEDLEDAIGTKVSLDDSVGGLGAHAIISAGPFMLIGEYITALDEALFIRADTGAAVETAEEISAWNAEAGYFFDLGNRPATAGLAFQGSDDAGDFLPKTRLSGVIGVEIYEATSLSLEYFHAEYENDDEADGVTAQLAFEF